jgi:tRNA A-37 threonylcarbamoyl transferase component Bud32
MYLHDTCQLVHGALTTRSCFVTKYWTIKLSDFGLNDVIDELVHNDMIIAVGERTIDGNLRML